MPTSSRVSAPELPSNLLWRHELRDSNAYLLKRLNRLELLFEEQEKHTQNAGHTARACDAMADKVQALRDELKKLEMRNQEFKQSVYNQLSDILRDMKGFREMQNQTQKLTASRRELDVAVRGLSSLESRVVTLAKDFHHSQVRNDGIFADTMKRVTSRLEALESHLPVGELSVKCVQQEFMHKCEQNFVSLQAEATKPNELSNRTVETSAQYGVPSGKPTVQQRDGLLEPELFQTENHRSITGRSSILLQKKTRDVTPIAQVEDLGILLPVIHEDAIDPKREASSRKKQKISSTQGLHRNAIAPQLAVPLLPIARPVKYQNKRSRSSVLLPQDLAKQGTALTVSNPNRPFSSINRSPREKTLNPSLNSSNQSVPQEPISTQSAYSLRNNTRRFSQKYELDRNGNPVFQQASSRVANASGTTNILDDTAIGTSTVSSIIASKSARKRLHTRPRRKPPMIET